MDQPEKTASENTLGSEAMADKPPAQPPRHPLFGLLKGKFAIAPGTDLTKPTLTRPGLTVVTRDRAILSYAKDGHVLALAC
jgi:hypothetical protein